MIENTRRCQTVISIRLVVLFLSGDERVLESSTAWLEVHTAYETTDCFAWLYFDLLSSSDSANYVGSNGVNSLMFDTLAMDSNSVHSAK